MLASAGLSAVPHDRGVAEGDLVTLDVLKPETWRAYKGIAEKPVPDFISSLGLFVKEQKPRPVGGARGVIFKLTGGTRIWAPARSSTRKKNSPAASPGSCRG